jgi:hypothetical protein
MRSLIFFDAIVCTTLTYFPPQVPELSTTWTLAKIYKTRRTLPWDIAALYLLPSSPTLLTSIQCRPASLIASMLASLGTSRLSATPNTPSFELLPTRSSTLDVHYPTTTLASHRSLAPPQTIERLPGTPGELSSRTYHPPPALHTPSTRYPSQPSYITTPPVSRTSIAMTFLVLERDT